MLLSMLLMISFSMLLQHSYIDRMVKQKLTLVQNQCNILGNQILVNQFTMDAIRSNLNVQIGQLANVWEGRILVIDSNYKILKDAG